MAVKVSTPDAACETRNRAITATAMMVSARRLMT